VLWGADRSAPLDEGRRIARAMPNAEFIEFDSDSHVMTESEPVFSW